MHAFTTARRKVNNYKYECPERLTGIGNSSMQSAILCWQTRFVAYYVTHVTSASLSQIAGLQTTRHDRAEVQKLSAFRIRLPPKDQLLVSEKVY